MYIEFIPNRKSRPTVLLREAWREGSKVRKRTIANLTGWSDDKIKALRLILKGERLIHPTEAFVVEQSLSCGHVHAILKLIERIRLQEILGHGSKLKKNIISAMVVHILLLQNASYLADCLWHGTTILNDLGLHSATIDDVTQTLEWLTERKEQIEGQVELVNSTIAAAAYGSGRHNTALALLHLLADHVNMNLHRVLSPLLSHDALHEDACTRLPPKECPLSLYASENPRGIDRHKDQGPVLSLLDIVDHLRAQCHIRIRISSIPGGMTVNLRTPASRLQKRVFELIEAYDGKGPAIESASWKHPRTQKGVSVPEGMIHHPGTETESVF